MTLRKSSPTKSRARPVPAVTPPAPAFVPPYPPSWFDRLARRIDQLPGPYWLPYLVVCLAFLGLAAVLLNLEGALLTPAVLYAHSVPFYGFWLLHYLDRRAAASLAEYRPAFTGNEAEARGIRWQLTTLPARPAAAASLVALLLGVSLSLSWTTTSAFGVLDRLQFYASVVFAGLYIYHSIRQLRLVNQLYATSTRVDLHNVAPLVAFSTLSAHTAIGGLLIISAAVLFTPEGLVGPFLSAAALFSLMAILAFLLPLMGLHRRLVQTKEQELSDLSLRWQKCMSEVYRRVDEGDLAAADRVNTTLLALERARAVIERIPTWPWRAETMRSLVAALILPVIITLLQYGLKKFLE
jgi:hypothetical protein